MQTIGPICTHQHSAMIEIGDPASGKNIEDFNSKHKSSKKAKSQLTRIFNNIPGELSDTKRSGRERLILTWHIALLKMENLIGFFDWFSSYILNYIRIQ